MSDLVYYLSYGSNINEQRFMKYVNGGQVNEKVYPGCRDKRKIKEAINLDFNGKLFFAGDSKIWGGGGVAFIDTSLKDKTVKGRAYLVSVSQFEDIAAQESGKEPGEYVLNLDELLKTGHTVDTGVYGRLEHLGAHKGIPVVTFTSPFTFMEAKEFGGEYIDVDGMPVAGEYRLNPPSRQYLDTIMTGLEQTRNMSRKSLAAYFIH